LPAGGGLAIVMGFEDFGVASKKDIGHGSGLGGVLRADESGVGPA
jgi:hypothetical protein